MSRFWVFSSGVRNQETLREHRWRHDEHLLFEFRGITGLGGSLVVSLLRDEMQRVFWI